MINISPDQDKEKAMCQGRHQGPWSLVLSVDKCDSHLGPDHQVQQGDTSPDS